MRPLDQREERVLREITAIAENAAPPPLDERAGRAMIREAALRAQIGRASGERRRAMWIACAAVVAAATVALALLGPWSRPRSGTDAVTAPTPAPADPMELSLPTGDRLTVVEGSRFELLSATDTERRISLTRGAMLFDVAPVAEGARFEVVTADVRVRVVGTVFEVHAGTEGTTVRVHEGRVEVERNGRLRILDAGSVLSTRTSDAEDPRLTRAGREAVATREAHVLETARLEPTGVTQAPVDLTDEPPPSRPSIAGEGDRVEDIRRLITEGDPERALIAARRVLARDPSNPDYRMVEADALRALRRFAEAADAYDRAAEDGGAAERAGAGYRAASLRSDHLDDPLGALSSLSAASVDQRGSSFEERGLALRARALDALGRTEEARDVARRYLSRYPAGTTRAFMEALVATESEPSSSADELPGENR